MAVNLAMEGNPLTGLEIFSNMAKEDQEKNIQELVAKYKAMGKKDHSNVLSG